MLYLGWLCGFFSTNSKEFPHQLEHLFERTTRSIITCAQLHGVLQQTGLLALGVPFVWVHNQIGNRCDELPNGTDLLARASRNGQRVWTERTGSAI